MKREGFLVLAFVGSLAAACGSPRTPSRGMVIAEPSPVVIAGDTTRKPDVIYVPTPAAVVKRMLQMARVGPKDVVYDLGCGDGRIVIAAARDFGARAVGIDIDPNRVAEARENVKRAGVEDKVEIRQGDMFEIDTSPATVVTLYLLESLNVRLRPKLQRELNPGSRIVSQSFGMGDWRPAKTATVDGTAIYLWRINKR